MVHTFHHIEEYAPFGVVIGHFDLLTDDPHFLINIFLCEVRFLNEIQQYPEIFLIVFRAAEKVAGPVEGSKSIS